MRSNGVLFLLTACAIFAFMLFNSSSVIQFPLSPETVVASPVVAVSMPQPSAVAWAIFDPGTGEVIAGENTKDAYPIASLTKLFTAYLVLQSPDNDTEFLFEWPDFITEGRSGNLFLGQVITPYSLLFPLLLVSSNDAASAIGRFYTDTYETVFSDLNIALGLSQTTVADFSGLSALNTSSVDDLAVFYTHLRATYPHAIDITRLPLYVSKETGYVNNNPLHIKEGFTGGKQGYTYEAGKTFVGTFTLPENGKELGIVLLGSKDLKQDVDILLTHTKIAIEI